MANHEKAEKQYEVSHQGSRTRRIMCQTDSDDPERSAYVSRLVNEYRAKHPKEEEPPESHDNHTMPEQV